MDRTGPAPESWSAQKSAANNTLARWFSDFRVYHVRFGCLLSPARYLRIEGSSSMASIGANTSDRHLRRPHRRSLVQRSHPWPGSPDNPHHPRSDFCFRTFFDHSFFESGKRTDRCCSLVFRFPTVTKCVLEVFRPSRCPGWLHHDRSTRLIARARDDTDILPLASNRHSFRVDFR